MSSPSAGAGGASQPRRSSASTTGDPVLRNALRYTISAREYATLHKYILAKSKTLRRATPSPAAVEKALQPKPNGSGGGDDYNVKVVRHALRVFVATWTGMKGYDMVLRRLGDPEAKAARRQPFYKSRAFRLSLSLSTILFLYRILFRFLSRLRAHLIDPQVEPFRRRNPRIAKALTSQYAPAVGAAFAGLALGIYPSQQMRVGITLWTVFRALEYGWNVYEDEGLIWGTKLGRKLERPWWFGSWLLQPLVFGQLLHAVVFDRDCLPESYAKLISNNSLAYIHPRPPDYPTTLKWPAANEIFDNLGEMARLNWPAYISPTMFPNKKQVLPPTLTGVSPLTSSAHPLITSLSCATLHPSDPSCLRTYLTFWLNSFPSLARVFVLLYSGLTIVPRFRSFYNYPVSTVQRILSRALRTSTFATGVLSTLWASICFFQTYLPRHVLPTQRFFFSGFFAGLWAWVERRHGRSVFLYSARASVDSLWKVGVKRRWWRAMKGGDVWLFALALMVTGVVYERDSRANQETNFRKGVSWVRGEGWRDWAAVDEEAEEAEAKEKEKEL